MSRFLSSPWIRERASEAVEYFWSKRDEQASFARNDQGNRKAATGGGQLYHFALILRDIALHSGYRSDDVFLDRHLELPGYFRPTKKWDVLILRNNRLVAALELKSHIGPSFGNNFNNRTEEALGSAVDLWTAYREKAFGDVAEAPWLGYLMLLEDHEKSRSPVSVSSRHFPVFPEFTDASYLSRYVELCSRLVLERQYSAAGLIVAPKSDPGNYLEPNRNLGLLPFFQSFRRRLVAAK
ncbi:MAG: restriction endonuclease [Myxococcales bacterium]|nr:restriction endonuclease [Myxococcales bacterium]